MVALAKGERILQGKLADRAGVKANPFGKLIYLDATNGSDGHRGESELHPVQTLARALALADAGDTVVLAPGGSETVTAAVAISLARLRLVCPVRNPEAGFTIQGAGTLDLVTVSAADVLIEGVIFKHTGATASAAGINAAATADRLHVRRCIFDDSAIATTFTGAGVELTDACNGTIVEGCVFKDCQFGVYSVVATGVVQIGGIVRDNVFLVGRAAAFGVASALTGTGALRGLQVLNNRFHEANGDGAAAATTWDGTDGTNATQGPLSFGAAVDQYIVAGNVAYTALSAGFTAINAIDAGAAGALVENHTSFVQDVEANVSTLLTNVSTIISQLAGATGVASYPAAAAPANNVSLAEVLSGIWNKLNPAVALGTTDIDDSVQDESADYFTLLTIAPAASTPLRRVKVVLDLAKDTTGFAAVESTTTIQFRIARKIDGTNWRGSQVVLPAALSGTLAAGRSVEIDIGDVGVTEQVRVEAILSADAGDDIEIPYAVMYEALSAPTITPVAAG